MAKAEDYLKTLDEARNLSESTEISPSRIRTILGRVFKDYFDKKIDEDTLIRIGGILHELQHGVWDYDPDIMGITCSLDDQSYEEHKISDKREREKMHRKLYAEILGNQTIPVSVPNSSIKKLKKLISPKLLIHDLIKQSISKYLGKKE